MNPRRRRAIARAILAGIPRSKLNSENIRKFLAREKAKGRLDLGPESIEDILFPSGFVNKPIAEESTEEVTVEVEQIDADTDIVETEGTEEEIEEEIETEEVSYSLENTKSELQARANELGLEYKKSLSKSKLLELINNN